MKKKIFYKIFTENYFFFFSQNRCRLSYCKALNKNKLISINKWLQSTDYKKISASPLSVLLESWLIIKTTCLNFICGCMALIRKELAVYLHVIYVTLNWYLCYLWVCTMIYLTVDWIVEVRAMLLLYLTVECMFRVKVRIRGVSSLGAYAPYEIMNIMFLPLMNKRSLNVIWGRWSHLFFFILQFPFHCAQKIHC